MCSRNYPELPFALHTSGPLLEWLVDKHPEYIARLRALVEAGRVEILGGGFFEPILTMIPERDRIGQIQAFSSYLHEMFGTPGSRNVGCRTGLGTAARLGDCRCRHRVHGSRRLSFRARRLLRGRCLRLSPDGRRRPSARRSSRRPKSSATASRSKNPTQTYNFLKELAARRPGSTVVFADDGEKFGSWPKTFDHVYTNGWLNHFCDMLRANRDWIETTTFARAVDSSLPLGKVFLPDSSYREMTEWALPPESLRAFRRGAQRLAALPDAGEIKRFFRAGGYWRNFKARYPECDEMYARMLGFRDGWKRPGEIADADPDYLEIARQELYRGQCNCPYWHGTFGGLYLPHLRNAVYRGLITAHDALDDAEGRTGPRVLIEVGDFNLDARQEVRLENDRLIAWVRPARGGHVYELDVRENAINLLATLDRRPEAYHADILAAAAARRNGQEGSGQHEAESGRITFKQPGLDHRLVYDRYPRKALVDHFYPVDVNLDDLIAGRETELGDFVVGTYLAKVQRDARACRAGDGTAGACRRTCDPAQEDDRALGRRAGPVGPLRARRPTRRRLPALRAWKSTSPRWPGTPPTGFTQTRPARARTARRAARLPHTHGITATDQWLDLRVELAWSQAASLWCFPIETVSQSEGGIEGVYQSSAIIPHWHVTADEHGCWDVWIRWRIDHAATECPPREATSALVPLSS